MENKISVSEYNLIKKQILDKERKDVKNDWLKIKKAKKENEYKVLKIKSCINCKYLLQEDYDYPLECSLLVGFSAHMFSETSVNIFGLCNKHKKIKINKEKQSEVRRYNKKNYRRTFNQII